MKNENYHKTIMVNGSAKEAMKKIGMIDQWWRKDFKGTVEKLNDTFRVPFGEPSYVDFKVTEFTPSKKMVWNVTDCYLQWFQDKKEWNNTNLIFQLSEQNGKTKIDFTHEGLVPEIECYEICEKGWNGHIDGLKNYINDDVTILQ